MSTATAALCSDGALFACDFPGCHSRYRRKEHLKRHQVNHETYADIACPYCDQKLTRKNVQSASFHRAHSSRQIILTPYSDLLRRHIRKYHPQSQLPASRSLKACTACRQRKEICEGGMPCKGCERRKIQCSLASQSSPGRHSRSPIENSAPSGNLSTDDYVKSYFHHFHPEWPFLHRSTFDPATEPGVLVQSVVMLGMWAYGSRDSKNAAIKLHDQLGSAIRSQSVSFQWFAVEFLALTTYFRANGTIQP